MEPCQVVHEPPIAAANRAHTRLLVGRNEGVGGAKDLLPAALTDRADQGPELSERIEGQSTVFFPGSSRYWVNIRSTCAAVTATPETTAAEGACKIGELSCGSAKRALLLT